MYICLEGVKGSGKSTIVGMLCEELEVRGIVFTTANPTKPQNLHSFLEITARLFTWLRQIDAFNEALYAHRSNLVASNTDWSMPVVLGDRSVITSYVTRWRKWGSPQACIARVDRLEPRIPSPDHVIYLAVSLDTVLRRLGGRDRNYGKRDETPERIQDALRAYDEIRLGKHWIPRLANTEWHVIDANRPLEAVFTDCLCKVLSIIHLEA